MPETRLMPHEVQVSVRLPQELIDRAEALTKRLRQNPDNALMGLTRATVLRLAIAKGIDVLEAQAAAKK